MTKDFVLLLEDIGALDCHDQLTGIPIADVRVAARAIAAHHAHCWERQDLLRASWTGTVDEPPMPQAAVQMLTERIPILKDRLGSQLPPGTIELAERIRDNVHPLLRALADEVRCGWGMESLPRGTSDTLAEDTRALWEKRQLLLVQLQPEEPEEGTTK